MEPFYTDDGSLDPEAVPGIAPRTEAENVPELTLEVDGEVFAVRPDPRGGTDYTWLSGPNPGYGFTISPTRDLSSDEHWETAREFLADIDPRTGHLRED